MVKIDIGNNSYIRLVSKEMTFVFTAFKNKMVSALMSISRSVPNETAGLTSSIERMDQDAGSCRFTMRACYSNTCIICYELSEEVMIAMNRDARLFASNDDG